MLINLTNHPFEKWSDAQKQAAMQFGECIDLPFPFVDPMADKTDIDQLTDQYLQKILEMAQDEDTEIVVHLMGEISFVYTLLEKLRVCNILSVLSTTERVSVDLGDGERVIKFNFVRFRSYY